MQTKSKTQYSKTFHTIPGSQNADFRIEKQSLNTEYIENKKILKHAHTGNEQMIINSFKD